MPQQKHYPLVEMRHRSLAMILRGLTGDLEHTTIKTKQDAQEKGHEQEPAPEPKPVKMSHGAVSARLYSLYAKLVSIREAACKASLHEILACFDELGRLRMSASQLKRSNLGRELNDRYWRKHCDKHISERCAKLLALWKALVAGDPLPEPSSTSRMVA